MLVHSEEHQSAHFEVEGIGYDFIPMVLDRSVSVSVNLEI